MVESTSHPVWYYLALFLIVSFFFIFLAFNSITLLIYLPFSIYAECLVWVWQTKDLSNVNLNFFATKAKVCWWNTLQQLVDIYVTIFCWKVSRNIYRVKVFKSTTLLKRDSNTGVFLWIFFFFWNSILKNTCERLLLESTYIKIYALLNTSS